MPGSQQQPENEASKKALVLHLWQNRPTVVLQTHTHTHSHTPTHIVLTYATMDIIYENVAHQHEKKTLCRLLLQLYSFGVVFAGNSGGK